MKARWKITLTLLAPVLLISSGIYLKLISSTQHAKLEYTSYYQQVARPAIEALNQDGSATHTAGNRAPLNYNDRIAAMSAMLQNVRNQQQYTKAVRRNRIVGYAVLGMWTFTAAVLTAAYFDKEKRAHDNAPSAPNI